MRDNFTFDRNEMLDNLRIRLMTLAQNYNNAVYYASDIVQSEQSHNIALNRLRNYADKLNFVTDIYINEIGMNIELTYDGPLLLKSVTINNYYYDYKYSKREFSCQVYD